jgi:hypothetical protein
MNGRQATLFEPIAVHHSSFIIHHSSFTKGDPAMLPNFSRHLAAQQASLKERTMSRHQLDLRGTDHD